MNDLQDYITNLFSNHKETKEIKELKEEILSNLEAKVEDLMSSGFSYEDSFIKAKESITNIDLLLGYDKNVYSFQLKIEYYQSFLLYTLIFWIITMPFMLFKGYQLINYCFFITWIIIAIKYCFLYRSKDTFMQEKSYYNIQSFLKAKKVSWCLWSIFISIYFLSITALYFGSNLWFNTSITIDGPYTFATIILRYISPLVSIIIPLLISKMPKLILKYEVAENYEE